MGQNFSVDGSTVSFFPRWLSTVSRLSSFRLTTFRKSVLFFRPVAKQRSSFLNSPGYSHGNSLYPLIISRSRKIVCERNRQRWFRIRFESCYLVRPRRPNHRPSILLIWLAPLRDCPSRYTVHSPGTVGRKISIRSGSTSWARNWTTTRGKCTA